MEDAATAAAEPNRSVLVTIQQQAQELQRLRNENVAFRQALASRSTDVPTVSTTTPRFSGDPKKLQEFLDALTVYFAFRPTQFSQDKTKVSYLISALSGPALAWAISLVASNDPVLSGYSAFVRRFKQMFESQDWKHQQKKHYLIFNKALKMFSSTSHASDNWQRRRHVWSVLW
ncbi:protein LDOC1-like [Pleurodeles waltl]|uniref:protein LDOC1-like n=1 Tax=Pleurodeles waltl TaxID=8319 RepID=UPI003709B370